MTTFHVLAFHPVRIENHPPSTSDNLRLNYRCISLQDGLQLLCKCVKLQDR